MNSVNVNYLKCSVHCTCQHCQITACAHVYGWRVLPVLNLYHGDNIRVLLKMFL